MTELREPNRHALILVRSNIMSDARVRRQIEWLDDAGWVVDTVGVGDTQPPRVRHHYSLGAPARWSVGPVGTIVLHLLTGRVHRFRRLVTDGIDRRLHSAIREGEYQLVVFNDHHLLPWAKDRSVFTPAALAARIHADIHEYFIPRYPRKSLWSRMTGRHHDWVRSLIGDPVFATRSVVVDEIADLYASEFDIPRPTVIMSAPPLVDLQPTEVHSPIRLVHHGKSELTRGLAELIDAVGQLGDRYHLTMYLVGGDAVVDALKERSRGFADRVEILPAVPYDDICITLNPHDLEVAFFPPVTRNLEVALPNKLFEAIQARIGLVIGPTAPMERIVARYGVGVVTPGWSVEDLAATITDIGVDDIARWKAATDPAAQELNSEREGRRFLRLIGEAVAAD